MSANISRRHLVALGAAMAASGCIHIEDSKEYDIAFVEPIPAISVGTKVRANGIEVGKVTGLRIDPGNSVRTLVRILILATVPVRLDTRAFVLSDERGRLTIGLTPGTPENPLLQPTEGQPPPRIEGRAAVRSVTGE